MQTTASVLVVDDDTLVAESCHRVLAEEGYRVVTEQSGRKGLERALRQRFDLVVTDLKMPDLSGMELVNVLARERPDVAVVVMTGYGSVESAVEAAKLCVRSYIEKPFSPEEIINVVGESLIKLSEMRATVPEHAGDTDTLILKIILRRASADAEYARKLEQDGERELSGWALSAEARDAVLARDREWVEKRCGRLRGKEWQWLDAAPWKASGSETPPPPDGGLE